MHEVATSVIEVGGGRVVAYPASYDDYVYRIGKEIDAGLRAAPGLPKPKDDTFRAAPNRAARRTETLRRS